MFFKESHVSTALVHIMKCLKYMMEVESGRPTCRRIKHRCLNNCDSQTKNTAKWFLSCSSEVGAIPQLLTFEVPVLHYHWPQLSLQQDHSWDKRVMHMFFITFSSSPMTWPSQTFTSLLKSGQMEVPVGHYRVAWMRGQNLIARLNIPYHIFF